MIAIIDYGMGNLRSVENALHRLGAEYCLTRDPQEILRADRVLLPGVGHAAQAVAVPVNTPTSRTDPSAFMASYCEAVSTPAVPVAVLSAGMYARRS